MVRRLRSNGDKKHGLVLANGGVLTYQHVICLSSQPRDDDLPYPKSNPLPEVLKDVPTPVVDESAEGEAAVEVCYSSERSPEAQLLTKIVKTYTVEFNRDGTPLRGYIVGRLKSNGHRFLANHGDNSTLRRLSSGVEEPIGMLGVVRHDGNDGRNLFTLTKGGSSML